MTPEFAQNLSEVIKHTPTALEVILFCKLALAAFSAEQKLYIKNRDREYGIHTNRGGCQFPSPHPCNGDHSVQIHHLIPQRYAREFGIDPDVVENGITLCEYSHQNLIHPDMKSARQNYGVDKHSYHKVFDAREVELKKGKPYWNTQFDRIMHTIVFRSEQLAEKAGLQKPTKRKVA